MDTHTQKNRSILLVDDVELFLELEKTFFHREGFDLLATINPQEIMQLVVSRKPELVFLDMEISGTRGDDICRWIKQDKELQEIPVIMVLESGDLDAEALCRQAGCDAIIYRPVRRRQLLSVARSLLDLADRYEARIATRIPVHFGPGFEQLSTDYSVNLSSGGVFVATDEVLPVGMPLALRVQFSGVGHDLKCKGRVAWLNQPDVRKERHLPTGMGIRFSHLATKQLDLIKDYLAQNAA
ncbi:MAG: response regulator [Desulfuromonadales bacterium]|nr:response regulator [Desulfuromonadales bacterium]